MMKNTESPVELISQTKFLERVWMLWESYLRDIKDLKAWRPEIDDPHWSKGQERAIAWAQEMLYLPEEDAEALVDAIDYFHQCRDLSALGPRRVSEIVLNLSKQFFFVFQRKQCKS